MRLPRSKGEQHLTSWGWRVDIYTPCIPEPLFSNIHFSVSQRLCFGGEQEELFRSLYQVMWNAASSQVWVTPRRKWMEYLAKWGTCLAKGGAKWAEKPFPHPIYLLTACTGQQGKEQRGSSWNNASTWGFWQPSAAGAWGLCASVFCRAVSR